MVCPPVLPSKERFNLYQESELLPLSALQHLLFCRRQCGLIHLEQAWAENWLTAEGRVLHEKVHQAEEESRPGLRIVRGLRIRSLTLGMVGQADVVEFHRDAQGIRLPDIQGSWRPYPVEYKRGRAKPDPCDQVQLCAQALCLEEMLATVIPQGAFFYGQPHRRQEVTFDDSIRSITLNTIKELHQLMQEGQTPKARYEKKCDSCSLLALCMPKTTGLDKKIGHYLEKAYEDMGDL